ncbi:uncharacterized protein C8R40DRAFT_313624 [Lentinula edodes]|uniref:uncharacterized protein n=1 Tax=Lentinula edodes TaxID=5353 RepID=UPI001E8E66E2|nr:uncharacterized protein C8R40DRAFT_313624 [Lentinula edodes]KAH7874390.1 hypothetical protein C8R40DRAFT_313624 [Lentinula edodes]
MDPPNPKPQKEMSIATPMFENAKDFMIMNSVFNSVGRDLIYNISHADQFKGLYRLYKSASTSAMYNSETQYPPARCHGGTREAVLSRLSQWIANPKQESQICWLYGGAGVGKSSVAQTVAERFAHEGKLAATFFFWRDDPARNSIRRLIPSLVFQLTNAIPRLRTAINAVVESNIMILDAPLEEQFRELILQPFQGLNNSEESSPLLVILDGLDECIDGRSQERVLLSIARGLVSGGIPLIFLVTSRPEPRIKNVFETLAHICTRVALEDSDEDIRKYLSDGFAQIYSRRSTTMYQVHQPWPTSKQLDELVYKASGQFIFASTVLQFVDDDYSLPSERLRIVLGLTDPEDVHNIVGVPLFDEPEYASSDRPFGELDKLYQGILSANPNSEQLVRIIGSIVVFHDIMTPTTKMLEELLALQPGAVSATLSGMHSLLKTTPDLTHVAPHLLPIEFAHKSFSDFSLDPNRADRFFIDRSAHHNYLARRCLKLMREKSLSPSFAGRMQAWGLRPLVRLKPFTYALGQELVYHCNWAYHCTSAITTPELMHELRATDIYAYANRLVFLGPHLYHSAWKSITQVGTFIGEVNRVKRWAENKQNPPKDLVQRFHKFSLGFYVSVVGTCHDWNMQLATLGNLLAFNAIIPDVDLGFDLYNSEKVFCQIIGCDESQLADLRHICPLRISAESESSPHSSANYSNGFASPGTQSIHTVFVDLTNCHATLAVRCMETLINDNDNFLYAERYWCKHLARACPRHDLMVSLEEYIRNGRLDNDLESVNEVFKWLKVP